LRQVRAKSWLKITSLSHVSLSNYSQLQINTGNGIQMNMPDFRPFERNKRFKPNSRECLIKMHNIRMIYSIDVSPIFISNLGSKGSPSQVVNATGLMISKWPELGPKEGPIRQLLCIDKKNRDSRSNSFSSTNSIQTQDWRTPNWLTTHEMVQT